MVNKIWVIWLNEGRDFFFIFWTLGFWNVKIMRELLSVNILSYLIENGIYIWIYIKIDNREREKRKVVLFNF